MSTKIALLPEVFSASEIARAAGVSTAEVRAVLEESNVIPIRGRFLNQDQAVEAVTLLKARASGRLHERRLFAPARGTARSAGMPALASGAAHAGLLAVVLILGTMAVRTEPVERKPVDLARLVFVVSPGPGGGGGGGGLRQPDSARPRGAQGTKQAREPGGRDESGEARAGQAGGDSAASSARPQTGTNSAAAAPATSASGPGAAGRRAGGQCAGRRHRSRGRPGPGADCGRQQRPGQRWRHGHRNRNRRRAGKRRRALATDRLPAQVAGHTARERGSRRRRSCAK